MEINEAKRLISGGENISFSKPEVWADLGCGSGIFTNALFEILPPGSQITGIDQKIQAPKIHLKHQPYFSYSQLDFIHDGLPFTNLDGIFMANALHYVENKNKFLEILTKKLNSNGRFLIVEYNSTRSNHWVPFPINLKSLKKLFKVYDFNKFEVIGTRKSIYGGEMYAVVIQR